MTLICIWMGFQAYFHFKLLGNKNPALFPETLHRARTVSQEQLLDMYKKNRTGNVWLSCVQSSIKFRMALQELNNQQRELLQQVIQTRLIYCPENHLYFICLN